MKEVEKLLEKYVTPKDCLTNKDDLHILNVEHELSGIDIGEMLGVSSTTVRNAFIKQGMRLQRSGKKTKGTTKITHKGSKLVLLDRVQLFDMHYNQQLTIKEIALQLKVQRSTVQKRFVHYNIPIIRFSDNILNKREKTMVVLYGQPNASNVSCLVDKKHKTMISRYGSKNFSDTIIPKETKKLLMDSDWLNNQHVNKKMSATAIAELLSVSPNTILNYLKRHNISIQHFTSSKEEYEVERFLTTLGVDIVRNTKRLIPPYELDFYLPKYNIAIEFNGLYWHSEAGGKNSKYHLHKTEACEQIGIRLIHIFGDEWKEDQQKCEDTLRHLVGMSNKGVYGRDVYIREISWKIAKDFLNTYHLLNAGVCGNYRIGAYNTKHELVGVMVFGPQNNENSEKGIIELKRFVTDKKNNPGLGSKMFKYATTKRQYDKVIAFVDRRWFTGLVKQFIGFVQVSTTPPAVWWTNGITRHHRRFFTKKQLSAIYPYTTRSKRHMMLEQGYCRIWDSGKIKLEWIKNDTN